MPRRVGAYAKLLANYAADDAIIAAGEKAELLFVRGLAFCATSDSDGYITDGQLLRVVGAGMRDAVARAKTLVREGLWERVEDGYQVRSWMKIHETAEEKGRARATDRERKRRERDSESEGSPSGQDAVSERTADGSPNGVTADSLNCSVVTEVVPRTEQSTTEQSTTSAPKRGTRIDPNWRPSAAVIDWQREAGISDLIARRELPKFVDYWTAKAGRDATKLDWDATWRVWLRNTVEREPPPPGARPATESPQATMYRSLSGGPR